MGDVVDLRHVQGNITPGFNKPHQAFIFAHFPDRRAARAWLNTLRHGSTWDIASSQEIETFKVLRKFAEQRRSDEDSRTRLVSASFVNVAFSWRGLKLLLDEDEDRGVFWEDFRERGFKTNRLASPLARGALSDVHCLVILGSDRDPDLKREVAFQRSRLEDNRATVIDEFIGAGLPGGREHFGYVDGISQPNIEGVPATSSAIGPPVKAGEFILGYENQSGERFSVDPELTRDGSYLVFLKLRQNVAAFREAVRSEATSAGLTSEQVESVLVGRSRDGEAVDPQLRGLSHIGRAHPDSELQTGDDPERRRIIRRGIPYGDALSARRHEDDGRDRGLLFVGYQASIPRQFEHVWLDWLNNRNFPIHSAGNDPVVGGVRQGAQARDVQVAAPDKEGGPLRLRLPEFVSLDYGGYFFVPSIPALARLAGDTNVPLTAQSTVPLTAQSKVTMPFPNYASGAPTPTWIPLITGTQNPDYVNFLFQQNPYNVQPDGFTPDLQNVDRDGPAWNSGLGNPYPNGRDLYQYLQTYLSQHATGYRGPDPLADFLHWKFQGEDVRISKALRLRYTYNNSADPPSQRGFMGTVLIGFGGPVW